MITQKKLKDNACSDITEYNQLILSQYDKGDVKEAVELFLDCNTNQQGYFLRELYSLENYEPSVQRELYSFFDNLMTA